MIPRHLKGNDLIGQKCRPAHPIQNGAGDGITENTICTIVDVVRGHGLDIKTDPCSCCGQFAYIRGVSRNELILMEE